MQQQAQEKRYYNKLYGVEKSIRSLRLLALHSIRMGDFDANLILLGLKLVVLRREKQLIISLGKRLWERTTSKKSKLSTLVTPFRP